jgi:hypothetical protein
LIKTAVKKVVALLITISLLPISIVYGNESRENASNSQNKTLNFFRYEGNGLFEKTDNLVASDDVVSSIKAVTIGDYVAATEYSFGSFVTDDNHYFIKAKENQYLLSDRIEIDRDSINDSIALLIEYDVPENVLASISQELESIDNQPADYRIEVLMPSEIPENASSRGTRAFLPSGTSYYSYNSYSLKKVVVNSYSRTTTMKHKTGISALSTAQALASLVLSVAGIFNTYFSIVGSLHSVLDFFTNDYGSVPSAGSSDDLGIAQIYDRSLEYVYVDISGNWICGAKSTAARMDHTEIYEYYQSKGIGDLYYNYNSKYYYCNNYGDLSALACQYAPLDDSYSESIYIKIFNYSILL